MNIWCADWNYSSFLEQVFPILAASAFWDTEFFIVENSSVPCKMFSSIPAVYPLSDSSTRRYP